MFADLMRDGYKLQRAKVVARISDSRSTATTCRRWAKDRVALWEEVGKAAFLTVNEKREANRLLAGRGR